MPEKEKKNILFLCTGNACRSQMAEGWARHLRSDSIEVFSAGVSPGPVSERAAEVMREAGVDISGQYSKHVDDLAGLDFDIVITLCDNAREMCPVFAGDTKVIHRSFPDPAFMPGTNEEIMRAFREVRDQIKDFVETMPDYF